MKSLLNKVADLKVFFIEHLRWLLLELQKLKKLVKTKSRNSEVYLEPCLTSMMELFVTKIVKDLISKILRVLQNCRWFYTNISTSGDNKTSVSPTLILQNLSSIVAIINGFCWNFLNRCSWESGLQATTPSNTLVNLDLVLNY